MLASVATKVYYTPADQDTAEDLSEQLGVRTEQLRPETQTVSFWGMLQRTSIGQTEHERRLLTADEVKRLDESAAVVIVKGVAPILGTKLGSPAPELVDLAKPWIKRVALAAAACLVVGVVTTWALWPVSKPMPRLALTSDTPTPAPEPIQEPLPEGVLPPDPLSFNWWDKLAQREPRPWQLMRETRPAPFGKSPYIKAELDGPFATVEGCEAVRRRKIDTMNMFITKQPPGAVTMRRIEGGYEQTLSPKLIRREVWTCIRSEDSPS